jgi:hypothetical protein
MALTMPGATSSRPKRRRSLPERFSSQVGIDWWGHDWSTENNTLDTGDNAMTEQNDNQVRELSKDEMERVQGGTLDILPFGPASLVLTPDGSLDRCRRTYLDGFDIQA